MENITYNELIMKEYTVVIGNIKLYEQNNINKNILIKILSKISLYLL